MVLGMCCFVLFVVSAGLVGGSFKIIEPLEYGVLQNTISKEISAGKVYTSGRFFVGLARSFIVFPRTRRNILFASSGGSDVSSIQL